MCMTALLLQRIVVNWSNNNKSADGKKVCCCIYIQIYSYYFAIVKDKTNAILQHEKTGAYGDTTALYVLLNNFNANEQLNTCVKLLKLAIGKMYERNENDSKKGTHLLILIRLILLFSAKLMKTTQSTDILADLVGTKNCQHFLYLSTTWILSVLQADELVDKVSYVFRLHCIVYYIDCIHVIYAQFWFNFIIVCVLRMMIQF
jgi:hypothetical protein